MNNILKKSVITISLANFVLFASPTTSTASTLKPLTINQFHACAKGYYKNSSGSCIHSPAKKVGKAWPVGSSAKCADSTYSYSVHRRGTCSRHGGVAIWR
jgi:hypothetical protein